MLTPDPDELAATAARLGIPLTREELAVLHDRLGPELETAERLMNLRLPAARLPLRFPAREPGHAPTPEEDPGQAWVWRCEIGGGEGSLAGLRFGVKDHVAVAGLPMTFAAYAMSGLVADLDATVVTRMLDAGARLVGKLNMDNYSSAATGLGGFGDGLRVHNPHRRDHIAGGSSSGAAAAVAAGDCDIALAGDQAGSIRVPAAWCGILGLKPTFGLVPHTGVVSASEPTIDHIGPLTRTVAPMAAAMAVLAGPDGHDSRQAEAGAHLPGFTLPDRPGIAGLRIGLLAEGFAEPIDPEVLACIDAAVATLSELGAAVSRVSVPLHDVVPDAYSALTVEGARFLWDTNWVGAFTRDYLPERISAALGRMRDADLAYLPPNMKLNYLVAEYRRHRFKGAVYARAQNLRPAFTAAYDDALESVDVLLMPTAPMTAPPFEPATSTLDALDRTLFGGKTGTQLVGIGRNTLPFNYTGHPALSVPCGTTRTGRMPVGFQIVGRHFADDLLLRVAAAYEHRVGAVEPVRPASR
ncbi:amidase family protein [Dactylosporangium sp. CA-092794]|uniref:amidase family protein n=1 Tax=Dactylosporangium sp. CA-092794 TaxID=3239929 RepID=UPI003D8ACEFF